jgi:hypothetical protein
MCNVPSAAASCREAIECFPDTASRYILVVCLRFQWSQWLLVSRSISCSTLAEFLYLDFRILISFQPRFVSDGITSSISKQILSGPLANIPVSVRTPSFHSAVVSSCLHTTLCMCEYQFSTVSMSSFVYMSAVSMYRLYLTLWYIHYLPERNVLMLGGQ